ncbi:Response regulator receiver domain-containing protein [Pelagirhabdus alkalitolerans]|uniref:Response regulator receiver domain-containing protein n=1 Tax=Pelagirhabdus alkalitolerans TaxID=1612202 RepID=A0A1G6LFT4_9BACI|nr:response regulator transcription factor [Pelagirhabdus alkalitolerans]SDC41817.1 Response regulator receiver domain-containing protein [Pelagirhabdus alkalitolerans]
MKRILIVDDEVALRMLLTDSLEDLNCEVDEASNGQEAYDQISQKDYDILVLDYMMPHMTGIDLLQKLEPNTLQDATIIMLTAKTQTTDEQVASEAGVDIFIKKPFSPLEFINLVEGLLND